MERLTTYEPVEGGIPFVTVKDEQDALQKLAKYEDAEEEKILVIGKFPIDTEVWIAEDCLGGVIQVRILGFGNVKTYVALGTSSDGGWTEDTAWIDNDSLYSTRGEAEAVLMKPLQKPYSQNDYEEAEEENT